jgi:hypothetical protein
MNWGLKLKHAIRTLFRRREWEREMAEEMRFHREAQVGANQAAGMSKTEAMRAANLRAVTQVNSIRPRYAKWE